jgi:hypothetical protein
MMDEFITVKKASERTGYSESHIRGLLSRGVIEGEKFASVWMVDLRSVEKHRTQMERLGRKKHGVWADSYSGDGTAPAASCG